MDSGPGTSHRLAVVGHPVGHSRSPAMQMAALADLGLAASWEYGAIDLEPEGFEAGIGDLVEAGYVGVNVTVPHKEAALRIADTASDAAREIGAANTLTFGESGILAENTDGPALAGFIPADIEGKPALVLGAGGAARAAIWALAGAGATVSIWNRTASRAEELGRETGSEPVEAPDGAGFAAIVNASAAGMDGRDPFEALPLAPDSIEPGQLVIDMVYGESPGALVEAAKAAGATAVDGIDVLVAQGALSLEVWTGTAPDRSVMEVAARAV